MDARTRLRTIAWLYLLAALFGLTVDLFRLFAPTDDPLWDGRRLTLGLWFLWLGIGIGLLQRRSLARKLAIGVSWAFALCVSVILVNILVFYAVFEITVDSTAGVLELGEFVGLLMVGTLLFVWQLRGLHSPALRQLTKPTNSTTQPAPSI